jgi:hypothetical protein
MKISVNQLVVVSHDPNATLYRVKAVQGFSVGVIDAELAMPNQAVQWYDKSLFKGLTVGQMKRAGDLPS